MKTGKAKQWRVRNIHRGRLPSGTMAYLGTVTIRRQTVHVASMNQDAGSWFSYEPKPQTL